MKYLIFLPITLLSFGVAFGESDNVDMATEGGGGGGTDVPLALGTDGTQGKELGWRVRKDGTSDGSGGGTSDSGDAGASDKNEPRRVATKKSEIPPLDMPLDSTSDGSNDTGTDSVCPDTSCQQ
jgi:hypothetical protein